MRQQHACLRRVVVHLDLLDLENRLLDRRTNAPALVTAGPVVKDPSTSLSGHVLGSLPNPSTIDVELNQAGRPVNAVFVLSRGRVPGRSDGLVGALSVAVFVLVGEPDVAGAGVGLRLGIGEPLDVYLLSVALVEEHAWGYVSNATLLM